LTFDLTLSETKGSLHFRIVSLHCLPHGFQGLGDQSGIDYGTSGMESFNSVQMLFACPLTQHGLMLNFTESLFT